MAAEVKPSVTAWARASARAARSSARTTPPAASSRSSASTTPAWSGAGRSMARVNRSGRAWSPIFSASAKPAVVTSRVLAPLRSNRALVATVVPILIAATRSAGNGSPGAAPSRRRMPSTAASS